jgi:hypothetical protein
MADVGLRVNEARCLDLADVKWELGRFGKLHIALPGLVRPMPPTGQVQARSVDTYLFQGRSIRNG